MERAIFAHEFFDFVLGPLDVLINVCVARGLRNRRTGWRLLSGPLRRSIALSNKNSLPSSKPSSLTIKARLDNTDRNCGARQPTLLRTIVQPAANQLTELSFERARPDTSTTSQTQRTMVSGGKTPTSNRCHLLEGRDEAQPGSMEGKSLMTNGGC